MASDCVHVLMSARLPTEQYERLVRLNPQVRIHGGAGGIAIVAPQQVPTRPQEYPNDRPDLPVDELLMNAEVLVACRIPDDLLRRAPRLKWIQFTSAGTDHVWKPYLNEGTVAVTNARGAHGPGIAEFVVSGLLYFARDLSRLTRNMQGQVYESYIASELNGRTVAIVGFGVIGKAIGSVLRALGMHVIGFTRSPPAADDDSANEIVELSKLTSILPRADVLISCLPLDQSTVHFFNEAVLTALKPSAIFVNVGRGRTVDEQVLVDLLRSGRIKAAVLDVFEQEPLPVGSPLWRMPNVLLSPHMAGDTTGYYTRIVDIFADNLGRFLRSEPLRNLVQPKTERVENRP